MMKAIPERLNSKLLTVGAPAFCCGSPTCAALNSKNVRSRATCVHASNCSFWETLGFTELNIHVHK